VAQNTGSAIFLNEPLGVLVESQDWNAQQQALIQAIGSGICAAQGTLYARSLLQPLTLTTNGTMTVSLGGNSTRVLCDGYWCDGCAVQAFVVPAAPGSGTRLDAICIQASPLGTNVGSIGRDAKNTEQQISEVNVPQVVNGVNYQYVEGDTSGTPPAAPPGFTRFIVISIPANATVINAGNWSFDAGFPEMNPTGPTGPNPLSLTNGPITIPAVGQTCSVPALNGAAYPNGSYVTVSDGTHAIYGTIASGGTTATLTVSVLAILLSSQGQIITSGAVIAFAGSPGASGATGATGAKGDKGDAGLNGISPNPRGAWAIGTAYLLLDIVNYNGSSYIAVAASTGVEPDTDNGSHWVLIAAKGAQGIQGLPGTNGAKGDKGDQGNQGNPGNDGASGSNAYTNTTAPVAIPAVGATVGVPVQNGAPFPFGSYCIVSDGAQAFYGQVTSGGSTLTVRNLQTIAQGSGTVGAGASVAPSGAIPTAIPVGGVVKTIGANGAPFAIALPAGTWIVEAAVYINSGGTFEQTTLEIIGGAFSGSQHTVNTRTGGGNGQNACAVNIIAGQANGNQTMTFNLVVNSGSLNGDYYQTITATRIA
jgi:hypothetical protein